MMFRVCILALLALITATVSLSTSSTGQFIRTPGANRIAKSKYAFELDSEAMIKKFNFPLSSAKLISRAKEVLAGDVLVPSDLAEDFSFQFPVVGPLNKAQYLEAVGGFKIKSMFPDANYGYYDFRCDPFQPNRVWFSAAFIGTNTGDSEAFGKATGKFVECPPQAISFTFNTDGQVNRYTGGDVMDKTLGNSGGMGGLFGPLWAIGRPLPFPEAQPWTPSLKYVVVNKVGALLGKLAKLRAPKKGE
mmetsp:Transcript_11525/g.25600  ORF Transcript_11525/g.25600 Transcript_11525/m.25600 type:complete len:247 (+) Transcript_11525:120-860(+)